MKKGSYFDMKPLFIFIFHKMVDLYNNRETISKIKFNHNWRLKD